MKQETKNVKDLTTLELKAVGYEKIEQMAGLQNELNLIKNELNFRNNPLEVVHEKSEPENPAVTDAVEA